MREALADGEQFPLIVADPPWVPRSRVAEFPEDPVLAIDGGHDGMDVALECLQAIGRHLAPGGAAVLQLGTSAQVEALAEPFREAGPGATETREYGDRGVLVRSGTSGSVVDAAAHHGACGGRGDEDEGDQAREDEGRGRRSQPSTSTVATTPPSPATA